MGSNCATTGILQSVTIVSEIVTVALASDCYIMFKRSEEAFLATSIFALAATVILFCLALSDLIPFRHKFIHYAHRVAGVMLFSTSIAFSVSVYDTFYSHTYVSEQVERASACIFGFLTAILCMVMGF